MEFLERLGDRKFCLELCRLLEYLKHRERIRESNASTSGAEVFGRQSYCLAGGQVKIVEQNDDSLHQR